MRVIAGAMALCMVMTGPALAQTQAQQDRLDQVGMFVALTQSCGSLGMTIDPAFPEKVNRAFKLEARNWGMSSATLDSLYLSAFLEQNAIIAGDMQTFTASLDTMTDDEFRNIHTFYYGYALTCMQASQDPIFSRVITVPSGYDPKQAAIDKADESLQYGGFASWQTQAIQERGDMMMLLGRCRSKIGAARADALKAEFGRTDDPRERRYYQWSFGSGLSDTTRNYTLAQCDEKIVNQRQGIADADK